MRSIISALQADSGCISASSFQNSSASLESSASREVSCTFLTKLCFSLSCCSKFNTLDGEWLVAHLKERRSCYCS
ncbi:hypothetical protein LINGRAHAP2_LOCUS26339 [Linum grandiflorum]